MTTSRFTCLLFVTLLWFSLALTTAEAQLLPGFDFDSRQFTIERLTETHVRLTGEVEINGDSWTFYADQVDLFSNETLLVAVGNVVYASGGAQIAADRVEFNTDTLTGSFQNATGSVTLSEEVERSMFGTQEPDMYFYGETIDKLGPRTYRLNKGSFTSCIQPIPRWQVRASTVTLNFDSYAMLKNSVLEIKGVPVFYLPIMYYPIQEDDRATGILMPTYGVSTLRGQSLSNAFFWAIDRSHDVTIFHDWFREIGQGIGTEYRYMLGEGSEGFAQAYMLNERKSLLANTNSNTHTQNRRNYQMRANARHQIAPSLSARGQVDYFSDITIQQTYNNNIFEASNPERSFSGNMAGSWGFYQLSATYDANETFEGDRSATLWGSGPRIAFGQGQRAIPGTSIYFSFGSEYTRLLRRSTLYSEQNEISVDSSLNRFDLNPVVQIPFTRWPFLTVNSSIAWRGTYWTQSLDLNTNQQVKNGVSRGFFDLKSKITGPSFVKVWETPNSRFAERMKHVIEPWITLQRLTAIDAFSSILQLEGTDAIVGDVTQIRYGLNNRLYAKQPTEDGPGVAREILNVSIMQSYYSDPSASEFDRSFRTSFNKTPPNHFSPISLTVRTAPTRELSGSMRAEYDAHVRSLRTISAEGTIGIGGWMQTTAGWSQRRFIEGLIGFDDPKALDHYLNLFTTLKTRSNNLGGLYSFNYDMLRERYLQQRFLVYYNAQCCGISFEFQSFNFEGLGARVPITSDRRFNITFTLAGLGTFANVFSAFGTDGGL